MMLQSETVLWSTPAALHTPPLLLPGSTSRPRSQLPEAPTSGIPCYTSVDPGASAIASLVEPLTIRGGTNSASGKFSRMGHPEHKLFSETFRNCSLSSHAIARLHSCSDLGIVLLDSHLCASRLGHPARASYTHHPAGRIPSTRTPLAYP